MGKFKKIAAGKGSGINLPGASEALGWLLNPGSGSSDLFSEDFIKNNLQFLTALLPGWSDRYSPSAFYHALELDKNRGYNDEKHSQGAYEMLSPELKKSIEEFKKNPPKNLKDFITDKPVESLQNITVPESSNRYKAMKEKLDGTATANANTRFVKTSANTQTDQLRKLIPNWDIKTVLTDMAKIASRTDMSNAEKQQNMATILSQYERQIAPLSDYLDQNGIKYK
jgi:hypothetical protein